MISKTQISIRTKKKKNPEIVETIVLAKKNNLLDLSKKLSMARSKYKDINLDELEKVEGDRILVVGKVLGSGNISRKIGVAALSYSKQAREKLKNAGCDVKTIKEALNKNPTLDGVTILQ